MLFASQIWKELSLQSKMHIICKPSDVFLYFENSCVNVVSCNFVVLKQEVKKQTVNLKTLLLILQFKWDPQSENICHECVSPWWPLCWRAAQPHDTNIADTHNKTQMLSLNKRTLVSSSIILCCSRTWSFRKAISWSSWAWSRSFRDFSFFRGGWELILSFCTER